MSLVLPLPQQHPHLPMPRSRSVTPRPTTPLSAPPTPVTPTHLLPAAMERARSSEAVLGAQLPKALERAGRNREIKDTGLKGEWEHIDSPLSLNQDGRSSSDGSEGDRMDVDIQPQAESSHPLEEEMRSATPAAVPLGEPLESADQEVAVHLPAPPEEGRPYVWGLPRWGCEHERREVRKGVRLVAAEELPSLVERHAMLDTPSSVMFPWLHGISDDGQKGRDMAAFFGHGPPFEPPAYRGLCLLFCPPHPLDDPVPPRTKAERKAAQAAGGQSALVASQDDPLPVFPISPPRERSETVSTASESFRSSGTTEGTSPSIAGYSPQSSPGFDKPSFAEQQAEPISQLSASPGPIESPAGFQTTNEDEDEDMDVAMHPCDAKRVTPAATAKGLDGPSHPLPCAEMSKVGSTAEEAHEQHLSDATSSEDTSSDDDSEDQKPTCILFNALHVHDVFDIPRHTDRSKAPRFKPARLPHQINLRNLNIQQIKYSTVSDIVLYSKNGVSNGILHVAEQVARAQEDLWHTRMEEFYRHFGNGKPHGEGSTEPVRYGVWVVVEPFHELEKRAPHLVNINAAGVGNRHAYLTDLFDREAKESRAMTSGSEVVEGFWVGNDCDVPGSPYDGVGSRMTFDLCLRASECAEMPSGPIMTQAYNSLLALEKKRRSTEESSHSWTASPATIALRNLLSPSPISPNSPDVPSKRVASPTPEERKQRSRSEAPPEQARDHEFIQMECSGSCRTITGQVRNMSYMVDKVVELVYFLRKLVEGRDKTGIKRRILVYCQDGYTESSIIVLAYIMSSLSCSLPEAFLHLQLVAKRSFFLYPSDKPLLRKVDARLAAERRAKAVKLVSKVTPHANAGAHSPKETQHDTPTKSGARWRSWGMSFGGGSSGHASPAKPEPKTNATVDVAKEMLVEQDHGGSETALQAKVWFDDRRFDGFPSRILPFLYLGNLEHADNAMMLRALNITHVVSVGESLVSVQPDGEGGHVPPPVNSLAAEARAGRINVLDLTDVRDDGNDPLRPVIARACAWIEQARREGGTALVHCRVGVSRSASIVIAYLMQFERMGLMDAYMMCRARRLNVLIQPNLRFFHELFGWEVELARQEEEILHHQAEEARRAGVRDPEASARTGGPEVRRRILYSWPAFCRDLHCLNRRFLCN
ncbi:hypothetical protein IAU60_001031 [Kwoniella sp. DSM 27419]